MWLENKSSENESLRENRPHSEKKWDHTEMMRDHSMTETEVK